MIERGYGDLVTSDVDAIVNTVNTVGVMGTGLAAQVRVTFPEVFTAYARACKQGEVVVGRMHVVERVARPRYVINFPTKQHWRNPSRIEYIDSGLVDLVAQIRERGIRSIAVPPLGCGKGRLEWSDVKPRIVAALSPLRDVRVVLYGA